LVIEIWRENIKTGFYFSKKYGKIQKPVQGLKVITGHWLPVRLWLKDGGHQYKFS